VPRANALTNSCQKICEAKQLLHLVLTLKNDSMKKSLLIATMFVLSSTIMFAQVGISSDGSAPDPSAMLDVKATNSGILIPQLSTSARNAIPSPATGLLVYNNTTNQFNYFNGSYWYQLESAMISSTVGTVNAEGGASISASPDVPPGNSAMLDVNDPSRGILIPRTVPASIPAPVTGLMIYNTATNLLNYYNGGQWIALNAVSSGIAGTGGSQTSTGVAIKADNSGPHHSAILDVAASDKGLLIPRMTSTNRNSILPATGLVVYNATANAIEFYNGSEWRQFTSNMLAAPTSGTHVAALTQIIWNWNAVAGATGYKFNTTSNYATAIDMGSATSKTDTGLICSTSYTRFVWAYNANTNSNSTTMVKSTSSCPFNCGDTLTDPRDGFKYLTHSIGSQCWMASNLNHGIRIDGGNAQTNQSVIEKYCFLNIVDRCTEYGGLYQWNNVMQWTTTPGAQGICMDGWHVPTDAEWTTLTTFLGPIDKGGGKMKEVGYVHWNYPNKGANNSSGFTALGGGYHNGTWIFYNLTGSGYFWSSSENGPVGAWHIFLRFDSEYVYRTGNSKNFGMSVRCIKN
jgi:uncharacterized protein (TIGR02145 family)